MKYVIFHDAADSSYTNTVENFMGAYGTAQVVTAYFKSAQSDATVGAAYDAVAMACTDGEEDRAIEELCSAMTKNGAVQVIADVVFVFVTVKPNKTAVVDCAQLYKVSAESDFIALNVFTLNVFAMCLS